MVYIFKSIKYLNNRYFGNYGEKDHKIKILYLSFYNVYYISKFCCYLSFYNAIFSLNFSKSLFCEINSQITLFFQII